MRERAPLSHQDQVRIGRLLLRLRALRPEGLIDAAVAHQVPVATIEAWIRLAEDEEKRLDNSRPWSDATCSSPAASQHGREQGPSKKVCDGGEDARRAQAVSDAMPDDSVFRPQDKLRIGRNLLRLEKSGTDPFAVAIKVLGVPIETLREWMRLAAEDAERRGKPSREGPEGKKTPAS